MYEPEEKPPIELLPPLSRRCRIAVMALRAAFTLVPLALGCWTWMQMGWFYGLLAWLAGVFAGMILLSKLKVAYIPFDQHELSHSATAIIRWFAAKRLCG